MCVFDWLCKRQLLKKGHLLVPSNVATFHSYPNPTLQHFPFLNSPTLFIFLVELITL